MIHVRALHENVYIVQMGQNECWQFLTNRVKNSKMKTEYFMKKDRNWGICKGELHE